MSTVEDRVNFRCRGKLRKKLEEAAKRSGVTLSEQVRVTLERVYEVEPEVWLPRSLQAVGVGEPAQNAPTKKKAS